MIKESAGNLSLGSAVIAAFASSLCCLLPVVSLVLGLGAFGAASVFETLRPYLLVVAFLALGVGFYQTYFRREKCTDGQACATKPISRLNQFMLWFATVAIAAFALFPNFSGFIVSALSAKTEPAKEINQPAVVVENKASKPRTIVIAVGGMTCEGCASQLNVALKRQKGIISAEASYPNKNVTVVYDSTQITVEQIKEAIRNAGYDPK